MVQAAAVYARISSDDGSALGVARQIEDCHKLATSLGWVVAEDYIDNDVSAYSGKRRPGYDRMLDDIRDGLRDAVLVYHPDRLTRRPVEIEQFVEVLTDAKVRHVRFAAGGELDVANGDGLLMLRVQGAVAANESASKSRRVRRKMDEIAASGRPNGGTRPYGYDEDRVTVRPSEAEVIERLVDRYLAGESIGSLTRWLNAEGFPTVKGNEWSGTTVGQLLRSGRIAGLREHRGEVIGPAAWDAIITPAKRDKVLAKMEQAKVSGRRAPRRYLLSGMCRCGKCGSTLYSSARKEYGKESRRYVCVNNTDHHGCGRLTVVAPPVEELVADAVLYRLDTPELAAALTGEDAADAQVAALSAEIAAQRERMDDLAAMMGAGEITRREWLAARQPIEARITQAERNLARLTRSDALTGWIGNGSELRSRWADLNLGRQAAIVKAIVDHVEIAPGIPGARSLDPSRVGIVWRL